MSMNVNVTPTDVEKALLGATPRSQRSRVVESIIEPVETVARMIARERDNLFRAMAQPSGPITIPGLYSDRKEIGMYTTEELERIMVTIQKELDDRRLVSVEEAARKGFEGVQP